MYYFEHSVIELESPRIKFEFEDSIKPKVSLDDMAINQVIKTASLAATRLFYAELQSQVSKEIIKLMDREVSVANSLPLDPPIDVPDAVMDKLKSFCALRVAIDSTLDRHSKLTVEKKGRKIKLRMLDRRIESPGKQVLGAANESLDKETLYRRTMLCVLRDLSVADLDHIRIRLSNFLLSASSNRTLLAALLPCLDSYIRSGQLPAGSFDDIFNYYSPVLLPMSKVQQKEDSLEELESRIVELQRELEIKVDLLQKSRNAIFASRGPP